MPTVLAFDVNETLLDLRALDPVFEEVLGDASLRPQWFASMLQIDLILGADSRSGPGSGFGWQNQSEQDDSATPRASG